MGGWASVAPDAAPLHPTTFSRYWEPFLGSGAVFFDLHARGLLAARGAVLTDSNPDLIACYAAIRDYPEQLIEELNRLAHDHQRRGSAHYYEVRGERFNPQRRALAAAARGFAYTPALAAMFIYLNRTGYNGLFRLNADGEFNVPAGRYPKPRICDAEPSRAAAARARRHIITDSTACSRTPAPETSSTSIPVRAASPTSRFTATPHKVSTCRIRSTQRVISPQARGCHIVMSNSTAPDITERT
jgi:DNA adenine methylase